MTSVAVIETPGDWEVRRIGDIARFSSGSGIAVSELSPKSAHHLVPVFGGNGVAGYTTSALVAKPTVIVGRVGQKCGAVYVSDGPAWITDNALYPKRFLHDVDLRFFGYALEAARLNDVKNRNDLPLVTQATVHDVRMLWPRDLDEQRAIASALDDAGSVVVAIEQLIAKKRAIKQGMMQQLFTGKTRLPGFTDEWTEVKLEEIATVNMGQSPVGSSYNASGRGLPLVQGNADIRDRRTIDRIWTTHPTKRCRAGDVVLTVRAPVGFTAVASKDACVGRGVCSINAPGDNRFLYQALVYSEPAWSVYEQGSTFTAVNSNEVRSFVLPWPNDQAERSAIATVLDDADRNLAMLAARLAKAKAVKQGMTQELLTGRTRLRSKEPAV